MTNPGTAIDRSTDSNIDSSDLPMSTAVHVLGVEIGIHAESMHAEMYEGGHSGGPEPDIKIRTWQGEPHFRRELTRELSFWARRNLFNGAGPQ